MSEIDAYLKLLTMIEEEVRDGIPRIGADPAKVITSEQQKVLYSSVYLQLYNTIESTVSQCIESLASTIVTEELSPSDLSDEMKKEWVRYIARTHVDLTYENRLTAALSLCDSLISGNPVAAFKIEKGGGGNWDDDAIELMVNRLGMSLTLPPATYSRIKRPFRNGKGPLAYVKSLRNDLAHGTVSFAECGTGATASDLKELRDITTEYLEAIVQLFESAIAGVETLSQGNVAS